VIDFKHVESILRNLRSTRELRAEMLALAARVSNSGDIATLRLVAPRLLESTLREEWREHLQALKPERAARLLLQIESHRSVGRPAAAGSAVQARPNDRHAVLRLLLADAIAARTRAPRRPALTQTGLAEALGLSLTPIRSTLRVLAEVGLIPAMRRPVLHPEAVSTEVLARINALPITFRFRFARGAQIRTPASLLRRALDLLADADNTSWQRLALSGTVVALAQVPTLDLLGVPRLDLLLQDQPDRPVPIEPLIRALDDGLEPEPNRLAPAPVCLTLSRGVLMRLRIGDVGPVHCAHPADVFFALLDLDRRDLVIDYIAGLQA